MYTNNFSLNLFRVAGWWLGLVGESNLMKNIFHNLQIHTNNFCFGYIIVSCFFETFPADWVAGWPVGKSDFNENPVVSPDLDFGLRLRVCQKITMHSNLIGKSKTKLMTKEDF